MRYLVWKRPISTTRGSVAKMSQLNHVRSLQRGIAILQIINQKNGLKAAEIAAIADIPRPTVYRLLETLEQMRLIVKDQTSDSWRVAIHAKSLSSGFRDEDWVIQTAVPEMVRLGRQVLWPLDLVAFRNSVMEIRESTHNFSPYSLDHGMVGLGLPVLGSSSGRAYLAFSPDDEREHILAGLSVELGVEPPFMTVDGPLEKILEECRDLGVGFRREGFRSGTMSISAPVVFRKRVIACLTMVWIKSALSFESAVASYREPLIEAANRISAQVEKLEYEIEELGD